jgi:glycosyltransferase involved in cell wall biosynthesis
VLPDPRLQASVGRIESSLLDLEEFSELFRDDKDPEGLTIFIPNWNHRPLLPRALRSAMDSLKHLRREGFSGEILVIDDASRDGSQKFLRSVQAFYNMLSLQTICLSRNFGLTRLRNLALLCSKYRYVCMLDADNELISENLWTFVRAIIETDAALVYGNLILREDGDVWASASDMKPTWFLTEQNYIDALAIVNSERILGVGGYSRPHPYLPDDWEMNLHLIAEEETLVFVPAVLAYYHTHPLSASTENIPNREAFRVVQQRIYAQSGSRGWDSERVGRMYHPDVGFLD